MGFGGGLTGIRHQLETNEHIFIHCPFSKEVWQHYFTQLNSIRASLHQGLAPPLETVMGSTDLP